MTSLSIDPKTTRILLIGTGNYDDMENFEDIPQVKNNLQELRRLFSQQSILGVYEHNISICYNQRDEDIFLTISNLCDDPNIKTLIIYYAGHSCVTPQGEFYLTAQNSRKRIIENNGINFKHIKNKIRDAKAENILFLLDTCQSGRVNLSDEKVFYLPRLNQKKTWILTSSPKHKPSYYSPMTAMTYFTGALAHVLKQGIPSPRQTLSLKEVHKALQEELSTVAAKNLPKPGYWTNTTQKLHAFKNRGFNPSSTENVIEPEFRTLNPRTISPTHQKSHAGVYFLLFCVTLLFATLYFWDIKQQRINPSSDQLSHVEIQQSNKTNETIFGNWEDDQRIIHINKDNTYTYIFKKAGIVKEGKYSISENNKGLEIRLDCPKSNWQYLLANVKVDQGKLYYQDWHQNQIALLGK